MYDDRDLHKIETLLFDDRDLHIIETLLFDDRDLHRIETLLFDDRDLCKIETLLLDDRDLHKIETLLFDDGDLHERYVQIPSPGSPGCFVLKLRNVCTGRRATKTPSQHVVCPSPLHSLHTENVQFAH